MPKVLVTPFEMIHRSTPGSRILESAGFEVVFPPFGIDLYDEHRLSANLPGVDAMLAGMEPLNANVLKKSSLRAIARFGVGYDAIDIPTANDKEIAVAITPGVNQISVAEHTMALVLAVFRRLISRDSQIRDGNWNRPYFPRLAGKTIGLIGLGRIGREVAPRAKAFGMNVIACDPFADTTWAAENQVSLLPFDQVLSHADILSLHLPCSSDTEKLINANAISKMKDGAVLINTARGGLVDEDALVEGLHSGKLWGAGIDAFRTEPPPVDHPLLKLDNVVLTPHTAGLDIESVEGMGAMAAQWIVNLYQGKPVPDHCLVSQCKEGWKW